MKLFIRKVFAFLLYMSVCVFVAINVMDLPLQDIRYYKVPADKDIILLGHSQIECAVNDSITSRAINVAKYADAYLYSYSKLRKLIEANPHIKHVVVEFTNNNVPAKVNENIYGDAYLADRYAAYAGILSPSEKFFLFRHNPIAFIRSIPTVAKAQMGFLLHRNNQVASKTIGGYLWLKRDKTDSLLKHHLLGEISKDVSEDNIAALREIHHYCRQKNLDLSFIRTPIHPRSGVRNNEALYDSIRQAYFADVPVIDLKDVPLSDTEFGDLIHLNWKGARRFSVLLDSVLNNRF